MRRARSQAPGGKGFAEVLEVRPPTKRLQRTAGPGGGLRRAAYNDDCAFIEGSSRLPVTTKHPIIERVIQGTCLVLLGSIVSVLPIQTGKLWAAGEATPAGAQYPKIETIDPPEQEFFTKVLSYKGILIKAPAVVVDEALYRAYDRIALETEHLPMVVSNLAAAGAELHIIGRNQVTTDLPEWRQDKHVPLYEPTYNGATRDRRTRGMGGLITSCGEENLLNLPSDRYRGSDICLHEFAHNIEGSGMGPDIRAKFNAQAQKSKEKGLWIGSYAGSNPNEYFAELTMWYFGSHGSRSGLQGPAPEDGPEGLKKYDPEAFALFDEFYSGKMEVPKLEPRPRRFGGTSAAAARPPRVNRTLAGILVGHLKSYTVGTTKLSEFFTDAGMKAPGDEGQDGWHVIRLDAVPPTGASETNPVTPASAAGSYKFRVSFHHPQYGDASIADLDFKDGVLFAFKWNN